jgi:AcrR family transcriptional regulator
VEARVKPRRPYNRAARQARTRLARAAVVDTARVLFLQRGYPATTIESISAASGIPIATVYRLFISKSGILTALLDVAAVGDDEAVAMGDRPHVRALAADREPVRQLRGFAGLARQVMERLAPVQQILVSAAGSDAEAAALLAENTRQRQQGQGRIAHALALAGALRPELRERDAADIIHALMSPEVYRLLVADRQWHPDRYERWLADTLIHQLLSPAATRQSA